MKIPVLALILTLSLPLQALSAPMLKGKVDNIETGTEQTIINGQTGQIILNGQTGQTVIPGQVNTTNQPLTPLTPTPTTSIQLRGNTSGGQKLYGVLGAIVGTETGIFQTIFPESDLNRFGVQVGDRIIGIEGHKYIPEQYQSDCLGVPGTTIHLDVLSSSTRKINSIDVVRVDSRSLSQKHPYFNDVSKRTRYW